MSEPLVFNKTEESIFTLLSLSVLIEQSFEVLINLDSVINNQLEESNKELARDTIHEALIFNIVIKSCAYLDEWNDIFGQRTETVDREKILELKNLAKPAVKNLGLWTNLRDYRNHYIAHNHRNRNSENIYLNKKTYKAPQSLDELRLLVACIDRMSKLVNHFFPNAVLKTLERLRDELSTDSLYEGSITFNDHAQKLKTIDDFLSS